MSLVLLKALAGLFSPSGARARLSILIFHRVLRAPDPLLNDDLDAATFDALMQALAEGCNVLPLSEAVRRLRAKSLPTRAACVTFDDGYADNFEVALPVLQRHGITATFFISTGFLDGGRMWNDTIIESVKRAAGPQLELAAAGLGSFSLAGIGERRSAALALIRAVKHREPAEREALVAQIADAANAALPDDLMMTAQQVRGLRAAGMEIGGHTVRHPILARLDCAAARREIADGKGALEGITGERVELFAYPNGKPRADYSAEHVALVREIGFTAAVSTAAGVADCGSDLYQLPRFTPWDRTPVRFMLRLTRNLLRRQREKV